MFEVNGNLIQEDEVKIIETLRDQLAVNHIERFRTIKVSGNDIITNCPFHNDGQERKPSFGILIKDKGDRKAGVCHCFSCGYSGSIQEVISNCFGYDDFGRFGEKWLVENFLAVSVENRPDLNLELSREVAHEKPVYVTEEELDKYRFYHPYMWVRHLDKKVVSLFDVGYDKDTECLTFPVRDILGNCLFVARRSVKTKYFNYPESVEKPLYGIYELSKQDIAPDEVIICESMINCLTCYVYGKYAVALNGTGTPKQYEQLNKLPYRKYVLALDPDRAGNSGREKLRKALKNKLVTEYIIPEGKDINDLTKEEFQNLKEIFN